MQDTLILNADFQFHDIVSWTDAIDLLLTGKAETVEEYDTEIRSMSYSIRLPAVMRLIRYVKRRPRVKLTRANLLARDNYQCQYCGCKLKLSTCTYDHVVPVSQKGTRSFENLVCACFSCNSKKGGRTPSEAKMRLLKVPTKPKDSDVVHLTFSGRSIHELWRSYIYWNGALETDT